MSFVMVHLEEEDQKEIEMLLKRGLIINNDVVNVIISKGGVQMEATLDNKGGAIISKDGVLLFPESLSRKQYFKDLYTVEFKNVMPSVKIEVCSCPPVEYTYIYEYCNETYRDFFSQIKDGILEIIKVVNERDFPRAELIIQKEEEYEVKITLFLSRPGCSL